MPPGDAESRPLIRDDDPEAVFSRALDVELEKITSFYTLKEKELFDEVELLLRDAEDFEESGVIEDPRPPAHAAERAQSERPRSARYRSHSTRSQQSTEDGMEEDDSDDEGDEETGLTAKKRRRRTMPNSMMASTDMTASTDFTRSMRRYSSNYDDYAEQAVLFSSGIMLKKRMINLYVQLCELKSYIQLNRTGFSKVLKKVRQDYRPQATAEVHEHLCRNRLPVPP